MSKDGSPKKVRLDVRQGAHDDESEADSQTFASIGRFIHYFSQLEFTMRVFLAKQIKIEDDYFDVVTAPYDFQILSRVTQSVSLMHFPKQKKDIDDLFNRCRALNDERNRVAHGLWSGRAAGGLVARHVARTSLKADYHYENPEDLEKLVDTARALMAEFLHVLGVARQ